MSKNPPLLNISEIFEDANYSIPIYQREYAWTITEVTQLLSDLCSQVKANQNDNYYLGTLIINKGIKDKEEVIDGQQRLTTIYILLSYLSHSKESSYTVNFEFDTLLFNSRPHSISALQAIYYKKLDEVLEPAIKAAYRIIRDNLSQYLEEFGITIEEFTNYLLNKTLLLKVTVPPDTDLNHYFEIMNVRGEQLEKHEVLKSRLMGFLKKYPDDRKLFNTVWEAASDMNRYIQLFFTRDTANEDKNTRKRIFGKDGNTIPENYEKLQEAFFSTKDEIEQTKSKTKPTLNKILESGTLVTVLEQNDKKDQEQLTAVINFPNFLLHVLKIQENNKDIALDDKQLLRQFEKVYNIKSDQSKFAKDFCYNLLKAKFLFDKYIIRNLDLGKETQWVLRKQIHQFEKGKSHYLKDTFELDDNSQDKTDHKRVIMLESMFHVSFPTRIYKHWFNATLYYLFNNSKNGVIEADELIGYLEKLNDSFFFDRNQSVDIEYEEIIYDNKGVAKNSTVSDEIWSAGTSTKNFTFNRLDYLIWYYSSQDIETYNNLISIDKAKKFQFGFRSSVEHFFPQQPRNGEKPTFKNIDRFGNLCLISQQKNSRFSNDLPKAKKANYHRPDDKPESLKMELMWEKADDWNEENLKAHEDLMIKILNRKYER
ncbi:GmrSD restriction endonuclease domain-containing protein [Psychroflexus aestuariivivens]|uniref:GmrSD restriction endonuclease domain-containing protein n=1 Tax=Psychroflexus aestuariivivens TaxID=1795040 RepID=UPI000FDC5627|nr:DUF262 domain-containing protein [Psychroflexus aestuariivivens]